MRLRVVLGSLGAVRFVPSVVARIGENVIINHERPEAALKARRGVKFGFGGITAYFGSERRRLAVRRGWC